MAQAAEEAPTATRVAPTSLPKLVGLSDAKRALFEPLRLSTKLSASLLSGLRACPRTFLLYGPPGTGKTALVHALAAETGKPLFSPSPASLLSRWTGVAEQAVAALFRAAAREPGGAIIFLDEVDALGGVRSTGGGGDVSASRLTTQLLLELNTLPAGVYFIAATNAVDALDPAIIRRFERKIEVPLPTHSDRVALVSTLFADNDVACALTDSELGWIGEASEGYNYSDLTNLAREAAMGPLRDATAGSPTTSPVSTVRDVVLSDFEAAFATVAPVWARGGRPGWGGEGGSRMSTGDGGTTVGDPTRHSLERGVSASAPSSLGRASSTPSAFRQAASAFLEANKE